MHGPYRIITLSGFGLALIASLSQGCGGGGSTSFAPLPFFPLVTPTTPPPPPVGNHPIFIQNSDSSTIHEFFLDGTTGALTPATPIANQAGNSFDAVNGFDANGAPETATVDGLAQFGNFLFVVVESGGTTTAGGNVQTNDGLLVFQIDPTTGNVTQLTPAAIPGFDVENNGSTELGDSDMNSVVACADPTTAGLVDVFVLNNGDQFGSVENFTFDTNALALTATGSEFNLGADVEGIALTQVGATNVVVVTGADLNFNHALFGLQVGPGATVTATTKTLADSESEPEAVGLFPALAGLTPAAGVAGDGAGTLIPFAVDANAAITLGTPVAAAPNTFITGVNLALPSGSANPTVLVTLEQATNNVLAIPATVTNGQPGLDVNGATTTSTALANDTTSSSLFDQAGSPVLIVTNLDLTGPTDNNVSTFAFTGGVFNTTPLAFSAGSDPSFIAASAATRTQKHARQ